MLITIHILNYEYMLSVAIMGNQTFNVYIYLHYLDTVITSYTSICFYLNLRTRHVVKGIDIYMGP